ncbi:hypothetical protein [Mycobacterium malmoense]|uniref:hypothetical protein n=1 Tax=Mycobacterium malmoense TaxID=1780 RepID=UPI0008F87734|nr:hypothetical protein [Mycobacterium malmoense]OIN79984.1 hypothetical protein BMG05_14995 [Mycobacterium malmoense]
MPDKEVWNQWRAHPAHPVVAEELQREGSQFPNAGADLILKSLTDAGYNIARGAKTPNPLVALVATWIFVFTALLAALWVWF